MSFGINQVQTLAERLQDILAVTPDNVHCLVIDGGPCGGKTEGLAYLKAELEARDIVVIVVNEMATRLAAEFGPKILTDPKIKHEVQKSILAMQFEFEILARLMANRIAAAGKMVVLLIDRGRRSGAPYVPPERLSDLYKEMGLSLPDVLNHGYDGVLFMVTAANGAEDHYHLGNFARSETPEVARQLDQKSMNAWLGNEHLCIIGNTVTTLSPKNSLRLLHKINFEQKKQLMLQWALARIGIPQPFEFERKFELQEYFNPERLPVSYARTFIQQTYLLCEYPNQEQRVRMIAHSDHIGGRYYTHAIKTTLPSGERIEREKIISEVQYFKLLQQRNPRKAKIIKDRVFFVFENQLFSVDLYVQPKHKPIVEVELLSPKADVFFPPFLGKYIEVTDEPSAKSSAIADDVHADDLI